MAVCKKYDVINAWAFLLVKCGGQGNASKAIELYFTMLKKAIEKYKYNRKSEEKLN
jgi:hypothetical protein